MHPSLSCMSCLRYSTSSSHLQLQLSLFYCHHNHLPSAEL